MLRSADIQVVSFCEVRSNLPLLLQPVLTERHDMLDLLLVVIKCAQRSTAVLCFDSGSR